MNIEESIEFAKGIGVWVHGHTNHAQVKNDRRTLIAASVFQHVLDISDGIVILLESNLPGVALTLARPLHEGYAQGVWLLTRATENNWIDIRKVYAQNCKLL
jgi:hypothetical protein